MDASELKCPCRFQIPLVYNDGREVEPEVMVAILMALDRQFGGYTPLGTGGIPTLGLVGGSWEGQAEPTMRIEVAVAQNRVAELREVVYAIGKRLGQKVMYFDAPPPTVEFINIEDYPRGATSAKGGA